MSNETANAAATAASTVQNLSEKGTAGTGTSGNDEHLPEPYEKTTRHTISLDGQEWRYDATVGTLTIDADKIKQAASIFYTAFTLVDENGATDPTRPVTFIFNGGPGSSSTFLLLGSIAPKRISVTDTEPVPAAPYTLEDNVSTLLPVSDLVFIDAAGAGFSVVLDKAKPELWSVDGDVKGFSAFIRAYLTTFHRWNSPKYVLGESYGTTRGAALAYRLQNDGVALNGLILISNILDYAHVFDTDDQYYIGYFPTYASVAHYHGKAGTDISLDEHLRQARAFANGPLRLALAAGASLDDSTKHAVAERYSELTGLSVDYVIDADLRVLDPRFRKQLLRSEGRIVGRYDGRSSGYDMDCIRDSETFVVDDAYLDPAYSSLVNTYLRDELGWDRTPERKGYADLDWESTEPGKGWVWKHRLPEGFTAAESSTIPFPSVTADLAAAITHQPTLKVLIGNGWYDLCTPFFQTEYDIDHLGLPKPLRGNIAFTYYPAGHMLYSSKASVAKFTADLTRFYQSDASQLPEMNERPASPAPDIRL